MQKDADNDVAWFWLSKTYTDDRRNYCLQRAVKINPDMAYLDEPTQDEEATEQLSLDMEDQPHVEGRIFKPKAFQIILFRFLKIHIFGIMLIVLIAQGLFAYIPEVNYLYIILLYILAILYFALKSSTSLYYIVIQCDCVIGPIKTRKGWIRKKLMINDIDLSKRNAMSELLGYYALESKQGEKIYLYSFTKNQYLEILHFIKLMQSE